ncbi:Hypothetical predicted protein [Octopus vulgaris]|uniref:Uncharacterized protein n=1 Tax=Octopus vulgaris TaxID=6645 RepID=A0AA36EZV4_OCTVU|nr:Hypothetical predicted protein [Octopus vulgaris]
MQLCEMFHCLHVTKEQSMDYRIHGGRPSQERHTANSYSIWRTRNQDSRPYLDENKLANVRRDILRNSRLTDSEISVIRHATENDINIRHKGNEESDEQNSPPRGLIERLPSDQSTQRPEDTRNSTVPVKDSQENEKTTVTEDLAFAEEHRESMAEMRQKILNTLEVLQNLFRILLQACDISRPRQLWEKQHEASCADIVHRLQKQNQGLETLLTESIKNEALLLLEDKVLLLGRKFAGVWLTIPNKRTAKNRPGHFKGDII